MTKRRAKKTEGRLEDESAKGLPSSGSQSESEPGLVKVSPKKTPKLSTKKLTLKDIVGDSNDKKSKQKQPVAATASVAQARTPAKSMPAKKTLKPESRSDCDDDDGVVTFNFNVKNKKKAEKSVRTDSAEPESISAVNDQATVTKKPKKKLSQAKRLAEYSRKKAKNERTALTTIQVSEKSAGAPGDIARKTMAKSKAKRNRPKAKKKTSGSGDEHKSRKRKATDAQQSEIPSKKPAKPEDIFFYIGNLPPGVTQETLKYFLEEEGIHPKVFLKRRKTQDDRSVALLSPKQRHFKKNQMKIAKSLFATVIVKTEEEAKKLIHLNGISMPSPSSRDWDTDIKIVRRLPRPEKFPYKVHVGGLHPQITEDELRQYLESRGVKPGNIVIMRTQRAQKSRRFGFVFFESVPEADKAVDLDKPFMRDRSLVIQHSFKKQFKNF